MFIFFELAFGFILFFLFAGGIRGFLHRLHGLAGGIVFAFSSPIFVVLAFLGLFDGAIVLSIVFGVILKILGIHILTWSGIGTFLLNLLKALSPI